MATDTTTSVAHAQQGSKDEPPCVNKPEASPTLPVSSAASNSCEPVSRCPKKQCDTTTTVSKDSSPSPKPTQPTSAPPLKATAGEEPEMEGKVAAQQAPSLSSKTGCVVSLAENTCAAMKVTQSSSLTSSLSRGSSATADCRYFLPGGVNPLDIIPVVQVFHDLKGVLVKWTFPTKYLHLQGGVKVYEIYAYITDCNREEVPPVSQTQWTKVGTIHPLKLPMAVTLNNILMTKRYSFSVRAVFDEPTQVASQFSRPGSLRVQWKWNYYVIVECYHWSHHAVSSVILIHIVWDYVIVYLPHLQQVTIRVVQCVTSLILCITVYSSILYLTCTCINARLWKFYSLCSHLNVVFLCVWHQYPLWMNIEPYVGIYSIYYYHPLSTISWKYLLVFQTYSAIKSIATSDP